MVSAGGFPSGKEGHREQNESAGCDTQKKAPVVGTGAFRNEFRIEFRISLRSLSCCRDFITHGSAGRLQGVGSERTLQALQGLAV